MSVATTPARCPKCGQRMDFQPRYGHTPERFFCVCGNSIFNFVNFTVDWDALPGRRG